MFTGIVDHCGEIREVERHGDSISMTIACRFSDLREGESISVDGACLTAVSPRSGLFRCDLSPETLKLTRAGGYETGVRVNLERALRLSDRLGGHFVTGHVDEKCVLASRERAGDYLAYRFSGVTPKHLRYLTRKGSVAIQGVSLTVNEVFADGFEVMLIPHTLERTNLGELEPGDEANVELDWMTKVILSDVDRARQSLEVR